MQCNSMDSSESSIDNNSIEDIILSGILDNGSLSEWSDKWKHDRIEWDYHVNTRLERFIWYVPI